VSEVPLSLFAGQKAPQPPPKFRVRSQARRGIQRDVLLAERPCDLLRLLNRVDGRDYLFQ
jgi:hypothetical protein